MFRTALFAAAVTLTAPLALADGHTAAGEKLFARCKTCHSIANGDEVIVKGGKQGPNLYGIIGKVAGSDADFTKYGDSLKAVGETGFVWTEEEIASYVLDPKEWLVGKLDDKKARSKMAFKLRKGGEDIAAYLASFSSEGS